ncbi:MAG: sulfite exporter TauE/SafE family protein [Ruminococcaceae bacterium]|nr:sulfite exporter TauE/SafE family protein [Oscillospiraceae bacterium]
MKPGLIARIAGAAAGLANGLFGGGGGMVFLPILSRGSTLSQRRLYATCVGVIFPVCLVSSLVYLWRGGGEILTQALPYLLGGLGGGFLGGRLYGKVSTKLLKWLFAAFLFYAGVKYLL